MAHQHRDPRDKDMLEKHGRAHTKVAGDDEMLRTGFHNGTPLEAGKIAADSQPVDLFAPAHRLQQQQQQQEDEGAVGNSRIIAESEAASNDDRSAPAPAQGRQGMAEHAAGGRRLGRQS